MFRRGGGGGGGARGRGRGNVRRGRGQGESTRGRGAGRVLGSQPSNTSSNSFSVLNGDDDNSFDVPEFEDEQYSMVLARPQVNLNVRQYFQSQPNTDPNHLWVTSKEIPSIEEIFAERSQPPYNQIEGPWSSTNYYLYQHWLLRREDSLRPLREAVRDVQANLGIKESPQRPGLRLYGDVFIKGLTFSGRGLGVKITFSLLKAEKQIQWRQSDRLKSGSLIVLVSVNNPDICQSAVIAARPISGLELNPPEIDLFFSDSPGLDCQKEWIMVEERSSYWESDRHTLAALQKITHESFPFVENFVQVHQDVSAPAYFKHDIVTHYDGQKSQSSLPLHSLTSNTMDASQIDALQRILTKRLALCQGPPGTGKTYVSVQAIKVFLDKMEATDPPLIITCQTNHALDQLLRHIVHDIGTADFIRLGGRSKEKGIIKERTLFQVRKNEPMPEIPGCTKRSAMKEQRALTFQIAEILAPLNKNNIGVLDTRALRKYGILSVKQCESLEKEDDDWVEAASQSQSLEQSADDPIKSWLGKHLVKAKPNTGFNVLGFPFEEVDNFGYEEISEEEAERGIIDDDEDEIDQLKGHFVELGDNWTAIGTQMKPTDILKLLKYDDMNKIKKPFRSAVYKYLVKELKTKIQLELVPKITSYDKSVQNRKIGLWEQDSVRLASQRIIGVTTTGFAKNRGLLASLQPKIVLIEEAAETLEAPVIATCVESLEHLILVGDHKQLRPHCSVRELEGVNANISLFERLVNNGIECTTLRRQRRMVPEVGELLRPIYGNIIEDHPDVMSVGFRPYVPGMGKLRTFFFHHQWPEGRDHLRSTFNAKEAEMIVGLVQHLSLNELDENQITVLTFYNGQKRLLEKLLKQAPNLKHRRIKVVTVDSYQGEENGVIILSLVRSNNQDNETHGTIGFVEIDNRVCVALSRAQRGCYIFGNGLLLATQSTTWESVLEIIGRRQQRELGFGLRVQCSTHARNSWIFEPREWNAYHGGCDIKCTESLSCGHPCPHQCHPFSHDDVFCREACTKILSCGHMCSEVCGNDCQCNKCSTENGIVDLRRAKGKRTTPYASWNHDAHNDNVTRERSNPYTSWDHKAHDDNLMMQRSNIDADRRRARLDEENAAILFEFDGHASDNVSHDSSGCQLPYGPTLAEVARSSTGQRQWAGDYQYHFVTHSTSETDQAVESPILDH